MDGIGDEDGIVDGLGHSPPHGWDSNCGCRGNDDDAGQDGATIGITTKMNDGFKWIGRIESHILLPIISRPLEYNK